MKDISYSELAMYQKVAEVAIEAYKKSYENLP